MSDSKVSVLVTGGAGYIGSHAVLTLKDSGWRVAIVDNLSTKVRELVPEGVPFYWGSIADTSLRKRVFAEQETKAVMHFAGSMVVPESVADALAYFENNTVGTHSLLSAVVDSPVTQVLFSSTAAIYGIPKKAAGGQG